jgi:prepilin-type N-terminal cleavage/methylation domain-containing protein
MRGYSLLEVLVAISIVAVGVAALAQLTVLAAYANLRARQTTAAAILAQEKIEDLVPSAAAGSLAASPGGTLTSTVSGYADFVDAAGRVLGSGTAPPAGAVYLRRWSIDPLPDSPNHTWILQVVVTDLAGRSAARLVAAQAGRAF